MSNRACYRRYFEL